MPDGPEVLRARIRDIPGWPRPGVVFKDITPLLGDAAAFGAAVDLLVAGARAPGVGPVDRVLGIEARGFVLAAPVAHQLGVGFVPVRKPGKLPWDIEREEYVMEYGEELLEVHRDAVAPGERVLVVDDVVATGGTAAAAARLVERLGGVVAGCAFLLELGFLGGRRRLAGYEVTSLVVEP